MKTRFLTLLSTAALTSGCVQAPVLQSPGDALLKSNYPAVEINGVDVQPGYRLDIPAGSNTAVIVYRTYRHNYRCSFEWSARAGTVYEVTDHENRFPLTMYRWQRTNALWASRYDPIDPVHCSEK